MRYSILRLFSLSSLILLWPLTGDAASDADNYTDTDAIQSIYIAYYGRPGDPAGVNWWTESLSENQGDVSRIIDEFGYSAEYIDRFSNLNTTALVNNLYQQMFGRNAEAEGLAWWVEQIDVQGVTLAQAALTIARGAQGDDLKTLSNRTEIATVFSSELESQHKKFTTDNLDAIRDVFTNIISAETNPSQFITGDVFTNLLDTLPNRPTDQCWVNDFTGLKTLLEGKGHILKLDCKQNTVAVLMKNHTRAYIYDSYIMLVDLARNDILFESEDSTVTDVSLPDADTLIYTESNLEELNQNAITTGNYQLVRRDIATGTTVSQQIHSEAYMRDYATTALKIAQVDDIWVTSYRKANGSPWVSGWQWNPDDNTFTRLFANQLAPALNDFGFEFMGHPIGGSMAAFEAFTRKEFIGLTANPEAEGEFLVGLPAPSLGYEGIDLLHYVDLYNDFNGTDLAYVSTRRSMEGVDVIVTNVNRYGARVGAAVLATTDLDEFFGLSTFHNQPLAFGRSRISREHWNGFLAYDGIATSNLSLTNSAVFSAAYETGQGLLAIASTNWSQNPEGTSVSEQADLEILLLDAGLNEIHRQTLFPSNRFDRAFGILPLGEPNTYLVYGLEDGPGTHSADEDETQLRSKALLLKVTLSSDGTFNATTY